MVNKRPLTAVSSDPRNNNVLTPASLLTIGLDLYTPVDRAHDKNELRRNYTFNLALADRFWHEWMDFYLPTLQGRNKCRETVRNLKIGQLILVGDTKDLLTKEKYRVDRVAETFPQMHREKLLLEGLRLQSLILTQVKTLTVCH